LSEYTSAAKFTKLRNKTGCMCDIRTNQRNNYVF